MDLNRAMIAGRLGRDPEIRSMTSGDKVANLTIASSERWTDKQSGEKREKTEWHRVVIFSQPLGDIAKQYLRKGSKVYIEGQLQTRKWTDKQSQERFTTEVVLQRYRGELTMLDGKSPSEDAQPSRPHSVTPPPGQSFEIADEIPF